MGELTPKDWMRKLIRPASDEEFQQALREAAERRRLQRELELHITEQELSEVDQVVRTALRAWKPAENVEGQEEAPLSLAAPVTTDQPSADSPSKIGRKLPLLLVQDRTTGAEWTRSGASAELLISVESMDASVLVAATPETWRFKAEVLAQPDDQPSDPLRLPTSPTRPEDGIIALVIRGGINPAEIKRIVIHVFGRGNVRLGHAMFQIRGE